MNMPNIFDYLKWRGDLRFEQDGFNEVDNLILATLSYVDFGGIVPDKMSGQSIPLVKAAGLAREMGRFRAGPLLARFPALLESASETERFREIALSRYVNEVDIEKSYQFSALVFSLSERAHYIAFRGTDDNLAGWKEDFLMGFKDVVLAQTQAARYVNAIIPSLRGEVTLGGHSKGGNLAVFAAAHATDRNMKKIVAVYNNDGPGFQTSVIRSEGYRKILGRIRSYIPNSSVVGMLLEHGENYKIVSSREKGIMSHNSVTWEVSGNTFVHEKELTKSSRQINEALRTWMAALSLEQREQFVGALFDIIQASGAQTLSDLTKERLSVIDAMIHKLKKMDKETRALLKETVVTFFSIRQQMLAESIGGVLHIKKAPSRR
jgi:hypothetical protein